MAKAVVSIYTFLDDALEAAKKLNDQKTKYKFYSPVPRHEIDEVCFPEKSPVRMVSLTGAILGCTFGWSLGILTSMDYPMRVSAKNVVSVPGFFVPGYECTILFGGIFTLLGMFFFCKLPSIMRTPGYDPRFSDDKFGIVVSCEPEKVSAIENIFRSTGAEEISVKEAI